MTYKISNNPGSYIKIAFQGSWLALELDYTHLSGTGAASFPKIKYRIDSGAWINYQLKSTDTRLVLAYNLSITNHTIDLYFNASNPGIDRWLTPVDAIVITNIYVGYGRVSVAASGYPGRMIVYGDSITEALWSLKAPDGDYLGGQDAKISWAQQVAAGLLCEVGIIGFGSQGYIATGLGSVPRVVDVWDFYYDAQSRLSAGLFSPAPDWILINHGINDGPAGLPAAVAAILTAFRVAAPSARIAVIVPFSQANVVAITTGFNDYQTATPDNLCKLIDLGVVAYDTTDSVHPSVAGHTTLALLVSSAINSAFGL